MAYDLKFENYEDYISVEITGERVQNRVVNDSKEVWLSVYEICYQKHINKVLAVSYLSGNLDTFNMYTIVDEIDKLGLGRNFKLAFVDFDIKSIYQNRFGETVAFNRGYFNVKVFDKIDPARQWLLSM